MSKLPKKYRSGFGEQDPDINSFLRPDENGGTNPYSHSPSDAGYNSRWSDSDGYERGEVGFKGSDDASFLKPSWTGDVDNVNANHGYLIDNDPSLPNGKLLNGGGPLSQKGGIGAGPPRHAPKNVGHSGQKNWDSRGGVNRGGRR